MKYYTSDLHLTSARVAEMRGFESPAEMSELIIQKINETCGEHDELYIVGDVAGFPDCTDYLKKIKCHHLYLVIGNHDGVQLEYRSFRHFFDKIAPEMYIKDGDYDILLNHYPICEWNGYWQNRYLFYGHVHSGNVGPAILMDRIPHCCNVAVDCNNLSPKTAEELIAKKKTLIETYVDQDIPIIRDIL